MGSTDSAGNTHGSGSSCGLVSSLFPTSCRGRAESFARRLHRRLTSLGGEGASASEDEEDDALSYSARGGSSTKLTETSWLHGPAVQKAAPSTTTTKTTTTAPVPVNSSGPFDSSVCLLQMEERVLDSQPRRSPESDVYYDFDPDPSEPARHLVANDASDESAPMSPAEVAAEAEVASIFVNRNKPAGRFDHSEVTSGHVSLESLARSPEYLRDAESGCVYASPLSGTSPDTDNSEMFFDPESSETERTCENDESDRLVEAESEPLFGAQAIDANDAISSKPRSGALRRRIPRAARAFKGHEDGEDDDDETTGSSSSLCDPDLEDETTPARIPEGRFAATSSEESLNGNNKSSVETTSPSHESLWSTFDESTLSIQDDSGLLSSALTPPRDPSTLAKSHSDSEIIGNPSRSRDEIDEVDHVPLTNGDNAIRNRSLLSINDIDATDVADCHPTVERTILTAEENLKNQANLHRDEDTNGSDGDMTRLLERLASNPHVKIEPPRARSLLPESPDAEEQPETRPSDDSEPTDVRQIEREKNGDENGEDEGEEENNQPQRLRRCSSLKTGKTPPGTPGRKKIVRFADVLGLDLADVRTFLDEIPKIPNSAYSDLIYDDVFQKDSSPVNFWGTGPATFTTPLYAATMPRCLPNGVKTDRILVPLFQQPGGSLSFLDQVRERQVCLENVVVEDPVNMSLHGSVRVRNLDFHKSVHIRYTLDSWRNFSDLQATYVPNSCDGFSDKFTFHLYCHTLKIGQRLELAVRFQCKGAQYWDNNGGVNYCFQCLPATSTNTGYAPITAPTIVTTAASPPMSHGHHHDWSPTFY